MAEGSLYPRTRTVPRGRVLDPKEASSRPMAGSLRFTMKRSAYFMSLMAACAAANVLRAIFRIIPKCRSGVPGRQVSPLCRSQLLPHHHQGMTQQILSLPFRAVKSVRVVHGQTDAPYPILRRTFGKNSASCFFSVVPMIRSSARTLLKAPRRQRSVGHRSTGFRHSPTQAVRES